jgi:hypothetical protein
MPILKPARLTVPTGAIGILSLLWYWLFEIEDEIHQVCPILWWHVWDNTPTPTFNSWMYDSVDAINCHSYLTYKMCKEIFPEKTSFIPHSFPRSEFYRLPDDIIKSEKERRKANTGAD